MKSDGGQYTGLAADEQLIKNSGASRGLSIGRLILTSSRLVFTSRDSKNVRWHVSTDMIEQAIRPGIPLNEIWVRLTNGHEARFNLRGSREWCELINAARTPVVSEPEGPIPTRSHAESGLEEPGEASPALKSKQEPQHKPAQGGTPNETQRSPDPDNAVDPSPDNDAVYEDREIRITRNLIKLPSGTVRTADISAVGFQMDSDKFEGGCFSIIIVGLSLLSALALTFSPAFIVGIPLTIACIWWLRNVLAVRNSKTVHVAIRIKGSDIEIIASDTDIKRLEDIRNAVESIMQ